MIKKAKIKEERKINRWGERRESERKRQGESNMADRVKDRVV